MSLQSRKTSIMVAVCVFFGISSVVSAQGWYDDVSVHGWEAWCEEPVAKPLAPSPADCEDPSAHVEAVPVAAPANKQVKKSSGWLFRQLPKKLPRTGGSIETDIDPAAYNAFQAKQKKIINDNQEGGSEWNFWDSVEVWQIDTSNIPMILATIEANQELGEHASANITTKSLPTTLARAFQHHSRDIVVVAILLAALFTITFI